MKLSKNVGEKETLNNSRGLWKRGKDSEIEREKMMLQITDKSKMRLLRGSVKGLKNYASKRRKVKEKKKSKSV